ncbi:hypothetical protein GpartN1_g6553.t1 [Galdieria partita]|uniref:BZIP domain-containing protein n=1 Tax=Galdieria partita TaxID=83374 RepID=A0A9C7Q391_9RHOD|nr:hypothetical protein GpartN1_g6553.t1 [Galdieria partita]
MSYLFERISISSLALNREETPLAGLFCSMEESSTCSTITTTEQVNTSEISQENGKKTSLNSDNMIKCQSTCCKDISYPSSWGSTSSKGYSDSKDCSSPSIESGENNWTEWKRKQTLESLLEERKNEEKRLQQRVQKLMEMYGRENSLTAFRSDTVLSGKPLYLDRSASTSVIMYHQREKFSINLSSLSPEQIRKRRNKQKRESKQRCRQYKRDQEIAVENNIQLLERASMFLYQLIDERLQRFNSET